MIQRRDVFQAISDPTRRMIIQKLSRGPQNLAGIIEDFGISRQAIAKHIRVLNECGMVSVTPKGREQVCEVRLAQLDEVSAWVADSRKLWNQRFEKLEQFSMIQNNKMKNHLTNNEVFIEQTFNASAERVFNAWTDPEKLVKWYAPDGCTILFKKIKVETGGEFHSCISNPQFGDCWAIGKYKEVLPNSKIVFTLINADENGNPINPVEIGMDPDWPGETLVTVTFEEENGKTKMQLRQTVSEQLAKKTGAYPSWLQMLNNMKTILNQNQLIS